LVLLAAGGGVGWPDPPVWSGLIRPRRGAWARGPAELAASGGELVKTLERVPTGRLVVLGDPGSGKTVLLVRLVLDLLVRRGPGDPVPFLASLASWNPPTSGGQGLYEWLESRLILAHPALAEPAPATHGVTRARALLDARRILLVLDALDEIPTVVRSSAIAAINEAVRPGQRLVLASRTQSYRAVVRPERGIGIRLSAAAGVELRPLDVMVAMRYLRDTSPGSAEAARWAPILAALESEAAPGAAHVLATPLMVALARTIYNPRPGEHLGDLPDPGELLELRTRQQVQEHLLDSYISAAYRPHPHPARRCRWTPAEAERWLIFLARHLEHELNGTADLAWWQLPRAAPLGAQRLMSWLSSGLTVGLAFGVMTCLAFILVGGPDGGVAAGLQAGSGAAVLLGLAFRFAVRRTPMVDGPARALHWRPTRAALVATIAFSGLLGCVGGLAAGLLVGLVFAVAIGLPILVAAGLTTATGDLSRAQAPESLLAEDRTAFQLLGLATGLATGLFAGLLGLGAGIDLGPVIGAAFGLVGALITGLTTGIAIGFHRAMWGRFIVAQHSLARQGKLPRQLMEFLVDAHEYRGVLRRAGPVYQFRHIELQRRLATTVDSPAS
jgi:hypothetical protein